MKLLSIVPAQAPTIDVDTSERWVVWDKGREGAWVQACFRHSGALDFYNCTVQS
jgi:hypothetical protein